MCAVDKCGWWWWVFVVGLLVCVWLADRKLWQDRFAGEKSDAHEIVYSVQCSRRTVGNEGISKCEMYFTILLCGEAQGGNEESCCIPGNYHSIMISKDDYLLRTSPFTCTGQSLLSIFIASSIAKHYGSSGL